MPRSGGVYQFRMWVPDEKKYLRRSMKTTDKETAINRAEEMVFKVHSDLATGRKLFRITLGELVEKYLQWRWNDVEINHITKERWGTIRSQANALLRVKNPELRVAELDKNSFYDWRQMRTKDNPTVSLVTVRNETATIKQMFEFGYGEGFSHFPTVSFRPTSLKKDDIGRRSIFTLEEYDNLIGFMRKYVSKKHCPGDEEREQRMEGIGIDNRKERKLSYHSLRHFGITMRLRVGVPIFEVATMSGTSVGHIESHYGHIDERMKIGAALKNTKINKIGIGELQSV